MYMIVIFNIKQIIAKIEPANYGANYESNP